MSDIDTVVVVDGLKALDPNGRLEKRPKCENDGWVAARPRVIGCEDAGGWLIASQARQENFSRTYPLVVAT